MLRGDRFIDQTPIALTPLKKGGYEARVSLDNLAAGVTIAEILESYPSLDVRSVYAAIAYASESAREQIVPLPALYFR